MAKQRFYNFLGVYNKAYKSKNVDEKDFNIFLKKLRDLFVKLDTIDTTKEEPLKNAFQIHILDDYITTPIENIDLAIINNNKKEVIFEFKSPNNKTEMLQADSEIVNKKALQEAIWYFYNQDSKEISYNIKNVVITDTEHLFFFNPKQFCNKDLEKICLQFRNNQVAYTDTKTLYDQIGAKIKDKNIQFEYAEFNLIQYKTKILNNSLNDNDKRLLQYLYKALHPDFLLREYSPKDSNELNAKFYNELLYILGLKEEGKNQKKIVASDVKGTLRDRISYDLSCNRFDDIINLIIVWLNRLLFLKLFESQLISFNDNNKSYAFLNFEKIPNFAKLNGLFNILGKSLNERDEHKIPYLNSSLFEKAPIEGKYANIASIDGDVTLPLCKGSILSKVKNYPKNPTLLKYLLDFLEAYNFSSNITENDDKKDIINSSVLGLIFEKLNGYKDGSFFTPAYITEYMAETAINDIVLKKYKEYNPNELCNCKNDLMDIISRDNSFKTREERRKFYNELLFDNLKICDPAVGSGHFLVSVLNYIVTLKSELGLLSIPNKIEIQNDSLVVYEQDGETQFEYKRNNQNSLTVQKAIFDEKRKIIENCLFGVDINPNSVQICCLRLWIELLKNTYYIDNTDEMQILPNIDINIKCGNSLVSAYEVNVGHCASEKLERGTAEAKSIKDYKKLVAEYKNTESKISKSELKEQIKDIKNKIFPIRQLKIFENVATQGIFANSMEWMIEFPELLDEKGVFKGFDIVIANPPYMKVQKIQETQPDAKTFYENDKYITAHGSYDLANLFIELSLKLIHKSSTNIFIFPHKFLNSSNGEYLREYLLNNHYVDKITHFGANMIFSSADTYTCILQYSKRDNNGIYFRKFPFNSSFINDINNDNLFHFIEYSQIKKASKLYKSTQWILFNNAQEYNTFNTIYSSDENLSDVFSEIFQGIATSNDNLYILDLIKSEENYYMLKCSLTNQEYKLEKDLFKPILKGQDVHKYEYLKTNKYVFFPYKIVDGEAKIVNIIELQKDYPLTYQYVMDNEQAFKKRESGKASKLDIWYAYIYPKNLNKFEQIKLSSMEICSNHPNVTLNDNHLYHNTKVYSFVKKSDVIYSYEYLLAILNSNVLWWFLKNTGDTLQGDARTMKTEYLKPFPLPVRNENLEHNIENLVKQIFEEKQKSACNNVLCERYEKEINQIVYNLYNLTGSEINIIEGNK